MMSLEERGYLLGDIATAQGRAQRHIKIGPETYRSLMRVWRQDVIKTFPLRRALRALFNAGFRGRDLDLTYDA